MPDDARKLPTITAAERLGQFIEEAALNPTFDADKFTQVVRLHMDIQDRQDKGDFNEAFAAVQGDLDPIVRNAENRHLGNKYAGLDAVDAVLRPVCRKHGLSSRFGSMDGAPEGHVRKCLTVSLGRYSETIFLDFPARVVGSRGGTTQMNEQQQVGAVSTYARRYLLQEFFNLSTIANRIDDTDGDTGGGGTGGTRTTGTKTETKTDTTTGTTTGTKPTDAATRFSGIAKSVAKASTLADVEALERHEKVREIRARQEPHDQALIDSLFAARRAELAASAPQDLPDDFELETKTTTTAPGEPSELLTRVLARIASCLTTVALDSCAVAPEFTTDVARLNTQEGERATEAMKARYRELEAK